MVGPFEANFYSINGIYLESRKRREHLSKDDLRKNKLLMESLIRGDSEASNLNEEVGIYFRENRFFSETDCSRPSVSIYSTKKLLLVITYEQLCVERFYD